MMTTDVNTFQGRTDTMTTMSEAAELLNTKKLISDVANELEIPEDAAAEFVASDRAAAERLFATDEELANDPNSAYNKAVDSAATNGGLVVDGEIAPVIHVVKLAKDAGRALDDNKSATQLETIMDAGQTQLTRRNGWTVEFAQETPANRFHQRGNRMGGYLYTVDVRVACAPTKLRKTIAQEFDNIVARMHAKAMQPANRWRVAEVDASPYVPKVEEKIDVDNSEEIGYVPFELPEEESWFSTDRDGSGAFDHLYGLDDYVEIIKATLEAAVKSNWKNRVNVALIGPPACGKSDICKSLKRLLGEEAVLEFDGTSTTQAGAQQNLAEREELPRVLLVEEIEKAPESSLQWLLSVLDLRGEVRKTTARGNILKEVHMIGICTVNNEDVFNKLASGALASRFSLPLEFTRPPREILHKILAREIKNLPDGDERWIDPTLDYAESIGLTDPRKLIAICLTGRERLLNGDYQRMLDRTSLRKASQRMETQREKSAAETGYAF